MKSSSTSNSSQISTKAIQNIVEKLRTAGNRSSTRQSYLCVWRLFNEFYIKLDKKPETWEDRIVLFVGYLIDNNKKSTTIKSYVSAVKKVLLEDGVEVCENKYLISSLTKACKYVNDKVRIRLPIHKGLLQIILRQVAYMFNTEQNQPYLSALYRAMFVTAYYGLFRIGEIASGSHPVLAKDVHIGHNKNKVLFVLRTSKTHWTDVKPQTVKITSTALAVKEKKSIINACPFQLLWEYLMVRRPYQVDDEPFFVFKDRTPVSAENFRKTLRTALEQKGFNPMLYSGHSLRAGRTGDLAKLKIPLSKIRQLGRWRSNAVFNYLKNC